MGGHSTGSGKVVSMLLGRRVGARMLEMMEGGGHLNRGGRGAKGG